MHEIGIRLALGAEPAGIARMILRQAGTVTLAGVGAGLLGALALTRALSSVLYGVSATSPAIFGGVALLLSSVALLASYVPARRSTRVDPLALLRHE
jgi:putative ABC transport system permease protein